MYRLKDGEELKMLSEQTRRRTLMDHIRGKLWNWIKPIMPTIYRKINLAKHGHKKFDGKLTFKLDTFRHLYNFLHQNFEETVYWPSLKINHDQILILKLYKLH